MKKCFSFALALFLAAGFSAQVRSATVNKLRVGPSTSTEATYYSIAEALTAAEEGQDIEVESGTYDVSAALVVDKGVTIRGLGASPEDVVVTRDTSSGNHRLLTVTAPNARIENMTFSGGIVPNDTNDKTKPENAASIAYMTAGTISNCIIENGKGEKDSGWATGIILNGTAQVAPILEKSIIRNNQNPDGNPNRPGGGVYIHSYGLVTGCMISNNVARCVGGGVAVNTDCQAGDALFENCVIYDNRAGWGVTYSGGGTVTALGGGCGAGFNGTYVGCLIADNQDDWGSTSDSFRKLSGSMLNATLYNCTVLNNKHLSESNNGGLKDCTVYNSIVLGNTAKSDAVCNYSGSTVLHYSISAPENSSQSDNNKWTDPSLKSYTFGEEFPFGGFTYTFAPSEDSCAVNAASSDYLYYASTDITGDFRNQGTAPDIGCYEVEIETTVIVATLSVTPSYRNISYSAVITSRGPSNAHTATATLVISPNEDMSDPVFSDVVLTATNDGDSVADTIGEMNPYTVYWARLIVVNDLGETLRTDPIMFTTLSENPVVSCTLDSNFVSPAVSVKVEALGLGASSVNGISVRLWANAARVGEPLSVITKEVSIESVPTEVYGFAFSSVYGLTAGSTYYMDAVAVNDRGDTGPQSNAVEFEVPSSGFNVWANNTADMTLASSYVFGWVPGASDKLYFESPAVVQPEVNSDFSIAGLYFTIIGATTEAQLAVYADLLPRDYDIQGSGTLAFTTDETIITSILPEGITNKVSAAITISKNAQLKLELGSDFFLAGNISHAQGITEKRLYVNNNKETVKRRLHFSGPSDNFDGKLDFSGDIDVFFEDPKAMTGISEIKIKEGHGRIVTLVNATDDVLVFTNAKITSHNDWNSADFATEGNPIKLNDVDYWCRNQQPVIDGDLEIGNLVINKNGNSNRYQLRKLGTGLFDITGTVSYNANATLPLSNISLQNGCLAFTNPDFVEPWGYLRADIASGGNKATFGLTKDYKPLLDGNNELTIYAAQSGVDWGFTAFGNDIEVCIGNDASINVANKPGSSDNLTFTSDTVVYDSKTLGEYYAVPRFWVFGYPSAKANHTVFFKNPIEYDSTMNADINTYMQSYGSTVAARLQGKIQVGHKDRTWSFSGNNVGGYLALEADNSEFIGKVSVKEKANLLVNAPLSAQFVNIETDSALGGTNTLTTTATSGLTVKNGGALFGGEWGKGGCLTLVGNVKFETGAKLRAEVPSAGAEAGYINLTQDATVTWPDEVQVEVRIADDAPMSGRVKVLDWTDGGVRPTCTFSCVVPEDSDIQRLKVTESGSAIYLSYRRKSNTTGLVIRLR